MAFPKKGLKKITVDDIKYGYNITGNDGWISFSIGLLEKNGEILTGSFSYHENRITNFDKEGKSKSWSLYQRIKITPDTIRQVIKYGLNSGWNPFENTGQMRLGDMDDKIDLNLKDERRFPELKQNQVAMNFAKVDTGHVLKINKDLYTGEGEIYQVFDSLKTAKNYAKEKTNEDSSIECWIMTEKNKAIFYINSSEEKELQHHTNTQDIMNYQIIADEEKLKEFVDWLPDLQENESYYVSLFARKKYSNDPRIKSDKSQLKRFTSNKDRLIDKIRQLEIPIGLWKLKELEAPQDSLALYISINPRCMKKATEMMGKKCWDLINSKNYNIQAEALSCIQKSKSRTCYIDFDIDDKSIEIEEEWLKEQVGEDSYSILETRGGFHLLIEPEKATNFRKEYFNDKNWHQKIQQRYPVDQSGDQLLPVVGTFQGGFVPKFLKKGEKVEATNNQV